MSSKSIPSSAPNPLDLLMLAGRMDTSEHFEAYVRANPILLVPRVAQDLKMRISELAASRVPMEEFGGFTGYTVASFLKKTLGNIEDLRGAYERHERVYEIPCGGPIEKLWHTLEIGAIREDQALLDARDSPIVASLAPAYVYGLSNFTINVCHSGDWRRAKSWHHVLLVAVEASAGTPDFDENSDVVECDWVEIALTSLTEVPDARLLRHARAAGERVVARTSLADPRKWHGLALHRLGILHLEPYVRGRHAGNLKVEEPEWHDAFFAEYGPDAMKVPEAEWKMPPIREALRTAESYLRAAASVREGSEKALSLKALVQALVWLSDLKESIDPKEIAALCREAMSLDLSKFPQHYLSLKAILRRFNRPAKISTNTTTFPDPVALRSSLPPAKYVEALLQVFPASEESSADEAQALLKEFQNARDIFEQFAIGIQRANRRRQMAQLLGPAYAPDLWRSALVPSQTKSSIEAALTAPLKGDARGAYLIGLAWLCAHTGNEEKGLELLREAISENPKLAVEYDEVCRETRRQLYFNLGAELTNSNRHKDASSAYIEALAEALHFGERETTREILRRLREILDLSTEDITLEILAMLRGYGPEIESVAGDDATFDLQAMARRTAERLFAKGKAGGHGLQVLVEVAKGARFSRSIHQPRRLGLANEPVLLSLLEQIGALQSEIDAVPDTDVEPVEEPPEDDDNQFEINDELRLLAYARPGESLGGGDAAIRMANLKHSFDTQSRELLWGSVMPGAEATLLANRLASTLGSETVLLNYFLGEKGDKLAVYAVLSTAEGVSLARISHDMPADPLVVQDSQATLIFNAIASAVRRFRTEIQWDPGLAVVTDGVAQALESWVGGFLGDLAGVLLTLEERGKNHLCIVPHGPLHFFPFHLLGKTGSPLGAEWTITYLPHPSLLERVPKARTNKVRATAIGKSFLSDNPRGLQPMQDAVTEACEIAQICGVAPVAERDATPGRVLSALQESHYLHLSTHGAQDAIAPSFHALYLTPDAAGRDSLCAYEIDGIDVSTEVVTLSACETALGRNDPGDNLRGLPASLMLAGAATIIGTLWDVRPEVTRLFFTNFYRSIGAGKLKLTAFAEAQRTTRQAFPTYKDWGAFHFLGDWR